MYRLVSIYFLLFTVLNLNSSRLNFLLNNLKFCPVGLRFFWIYRILDFSSKNCSTQDFIKACNKINESIKDFNFYLLSVQKEAILNFFIFKQSYSMVDEEFEEIFKMFIKFKINKNKACVNNFLSGYVYQKINEIKDVKNFFIKIKELGIKIEDHYEIDRFLSYRLIDAFEVDYFLENFKFKINFSEFKTKLSFFNSLANSNNSNNANSWINRFKDSLFKYYSVNGSEIIFLLKAYSKTKNENILNVIKSYCGDSFLYDLILKEFSFSNLNEHQLAIIKQMTESKSFTAFCQLLFLNKSKNLIKMAGQFLFFEENGIKYIDFNKAMLCFYSDLSTVDFQFKILEKVNTKNEKNIWTESDFACLIRISRNFSENRKILFFQESFQFFESFQYIKKDYDSICLEDMTFFVKNYKSLKDLQKFLFETYRNKYFNLQNLDLLKNFPILRKIDGFEIDGYRFEVPKTNYDLYIYGKTMKNCIYKYSDKCILRNCALLGVYKNEKLLFNIELGIESLDFYNGNSAVNFAYQIEKKSFFRKKSNKSKRKVVFLEKKLKEPINREELSMIYSSLRLFDIIES